MKLAINRLAKWIGAVSMVVLAPLAQAGLENGNFEGTFGAWAINTGTVLNTDGTVFQQTQFHGGSQSALFEGDLGNGPQSLGQSITMLTPSTAYTFGFWAKCVLHAPRSDNTTDCSADNFEVTFDNSPFVYGAGTLDSGTGFTYFEAIFSTISGQTEVELIFTSTGGSDEDMFLDDVTLSNVPEPGSLLLVGAALTAGAIIRRRRVV